MKKGLIFSWVLLSIMTSAQKSNCTNTEQELEKYKAQNSQFIKDNEYYKETLNLSKPIVKASVNDLEFVITSVKANKKNKTLEITFLYKNVSNVVRPRFQCTKASIVDDRGNLTSTYEVNKNSIRIENIKPDLPIKAYANFKVEEIEFPIIKQFKIDFFTIGDKKEGDIGSAVFENIPVMW